MKKGFVLVMQMALPALLLAQMPSPAQQIAEMKKLEFLVGQWKGQGWVEFMPGRRSNFTSMETVQRKLDGTVLVVEGVHKGKFPGRDEEVIVHNTLGIFSYDEKAGHYRFRTYLANGLSGDHEARLGEGVLVWSLHDPRAGHMRYMIRLSEAGQWFEIGERSQDGQTWQKFFEMTLDRQK